ncbi:MAG: HNH endonuclease [Tateyamaria sp.]|uniref:HNH endonuclease n=1 Tax=Alphaproteobacteria TaxID=28211 RepID=UPI003266D5CB
MSRPDIDELRKSLRYCAVTGYLFWRYRDDVPAWWNTRFAHQPALTADCQGYKIGRFQGRMLKAHRAAFAIVYGYFPKEVDYANGNRADNRLMNLRPSDRSANMRNTRRRSNNTSGTTGVYLHKLTRKWRATIRVDGKNLHLGHFDRLEDAAAARKAAEIKYGFDELHGRSDKVRAARDLDAA